MRFISFFLRRPLLILLILLFMIIIAISQSIWFWQLFYPLDYEDIVFEAAEENSLDPYLVMAVIFVESRFSVGVESIRGARGLMQIMPDTGEWIAEQLQLDGYHHDLLYEPYYNITLGCWYLSKLREAFDGDLVLALASYNAGSGTVNRWLKNDVWDGTWERKDDIPYQETEYYLGRVFNAYNRYRQLYGAETPD